MENQPEIFDIIKEKKVKVAIEIPCCFVDESASGYVQYYLITDVKKLPAQIILFKDGQINTGHTLLDPNVIVSKNKKCELSVWNEAVDKAKEYLEKQKL